MSRNTRITFVLFGLMVVVLAAIAIIATTSNSSHGLRADVLSPRTAEPGDTIDIVVSARDSKGKVAKIELDYGDGSRFTDETRTCAGANDSPTTAEFRISHRYPFPGVYTIRAKVTSGCTDGTEQVEPERTLEVKKITTR